MTKMNLLKDLVGQLSDNLPNHLAAFKQDFEKHCQTILNTVFNKLDLVTREEFEVQTKVLARTRKKIEELQQQLHELEKHTHKDDK